MKKIFFIFILLVAVLSFGCATSGGPDSGPSDGADIALDADGGSKPITSEADMVKVSFEFLKQEMAKTHQGIFLVSVLSAKEQVVAGYKITMECEYRDGGNTGTLTAVVYHDPSNVISVLDISF
ncbi:MAG: hypothetical protein JW904_10460 [Spirochaetales bacterium]|nr:hypothetical protein [Spirochaetales bacterium]